VAARVHRRAIGARHLGIASHGSRRVDRISVGKPIDFIFRNLISENANAPARLLLECIDSIFFTLRAAVNRIISSKMQCRCNADGT
jgi:hypothetical protein